MRADVHMDMVGGDLFKNKSVLHVTETPWSLPTFITDIGAAFAEAIRDAANRLHRGRQRKRRRRDRGPRRCAWYPQRILRG